VIRNDFNLSNGEENRMRSSYVTQIFRTEEVLGNFLKMEGKRDNLRRKLRKLSISDLREMLINKLQLTYKK
jgi:hypothetical protein